MEKLIGSTPAGMGLATTAVLVVLLERLIRLAAELLRGRRLRTFCAKHEMILNLTKALFP
jgi:hypothetical protein